MTRAKSWFENLTTLSKIEGQSSPRTEIPKHEIRNNFK